MAPLIGIEEARAAVLAHVVPLETELVPLGEAVGRVAATDVDATVDLPPFAASAMDGFALRAADTPGRLPVVGRVAAGRPSGDGLQPGGVMGIATGGVVPLGADAVIPIEHVVDHGDTIEIASAVAVGENIRPAGGDVRRGERVVAAGTAITPGLVAALASTGVAEVACVRRPRVAVLSTGTELVAPGGVLGPGQIYESNGVMIEAALEIAGAVVDRIPPVADEQDAHRAAIEHGLEADVLVTSGGVSVGPHDLVRGILESLGVREVFWGIAMRPGKPLAFGVRERTLVFGLPGNPVSSLVGVELFVRPAVRALQGDTRPGPEWLSGVVSEPLRRNPHRDDLVRARARYDAASGAVVLDPILGQESHMITRTAGADALVHVRAGDGAVEAGAPVAYVRLG